MSSTLTEKQNKVIQFNISSPNTYVQNIYHDALIKGKFYFFICRLQNENASCQTKRCETSGTIAISATNTSPFAVGGDNIFFKLE